MTKRILTYVTFVLMGMTVSTAVARQGLIEFTDDQHVQFRQKMKASEGLVTDQILAYYLDAMERNVKDTVSLSPDCWAWINKHPQIRQGLLGASYPVRESMFMDVDRFRRALGDKADTYANLILAFAYYTPHKQEEPDTGPDLTSEVAKLVKYMSRENLSLIDVVRDEATVLSKLSIRLKHKKDKERLWSEVALASKSHPERVYPSRLEFMTYLIDHYEQSITIKAKPLPPGKKKKTPKPENYRWPNFPLDTADWPILIPLGATMPLDECNYVWDRFIHGDGVVRYSKYGFNYKKPEIRYKKSDWYPKSYPRILEDGGVCGRQSALARIANLTLGIPTVHMGQPKHSAYVAFNYSDQEGYTVHKGQSVGPDYKSKVVWPFRNAQGWRTIPDVNKCYMEYQRGLVSALNAGLSTCIKSRMCMHLSRALKDLSPEQEIPYVENALKLNPYNTEAYYRLAAVLMNDLDAIERLVGMIRRLATDPNIDFGEIKEANTDLSDQQEKAPGSAASQSAWSLAVSSVIMEQVYTLGTFNEVQNLQALNNLQVELEYQQRLAKSPHLGPIQILVNQYHIKVHGIGPTKERVEAEIKALFASLKTCTNSKQIKKLLKEVRGYDDAIDLVLEHLSSPTDKIDYIVQFEDDFPEKHRFKRSKDKVKPDDFYNHLLKRKIETYRKAGDKTKANKVSEAYEARKAKYTATVLE